LAQKQEVKTIQAIRIQQPPKVDGVPDDVQWEKAESATGLYV